ncbi:MAG: hypothetical protein WCO86_10915 [Planctomycetota bacterium]
MEVALKKVMDATAATVVRQFVPVRIEGQVLAQVFALVCGQPSETAAGSESGSNAPAQLVADDDQPTEAFVAGRRAA